VDQISELTVREALPGDASIWLRLRQRLWPDAEPSELRGQIEAFFSSGTPTVALALLAFEGDTAMGFAEVSLRPYVPGSTTTSAPFLEGWFVEPNARQRGIGRALIQAVEQWAIDQGFREVGSDTILENESAALAHRALGFREVERVRFFIKDLEPDSSRAQTRPARG
jgi:aminoglycoside 6'-N-acetyltransferase I